MLQQILIKDFFLFLINHICTQVPILLGGPNWLTNIWGRNWMSTMVMSNFPAPAHKLTVMNSADLEDCFFWLPPLRGNAGLDGFYIYQYS